MLDTWEIALRLLLAALLGGIIGADRGRLEWAAGLRTHMLVCVGAVVRRPVTSVPRSNAAARAWRTAATSAAAVATIPENSAWPHWRAIRQHPTTAAMIKIAQPRPPSSTAMTASQAVAAPGTSRSSRIACSYSA